ncbi:MAG: efflux RND transporter periplasmic adaptor subunit, partial [bacterium]
MRKRTFLIIMLIVVAGGLALFGIYRQTTEEPVEVRTITVQKGSLVSSVIAPGRINSERIEAIKAPIEGVIKGDGHLKEGSGVKKGEIIAAIRKLDEELATIRQDLELAEIDLELIQEQKAQAQELLAAKAISQKQLRELEIREYKQEITVANLREKLKEKPIVAPFSGVITKKNFEPGQKVEAGAELLTVVDMSALLTVLWV